MRDSPITFYTAESLSGDSAAPFVDIPSVPISHLVVIVRVEVFIRTATGRRNISAKDVTVERYQNDIDGIARDVVSPLSTFNIPISFDRDKRVMFSSNYPAYSAAQGFPELTGRGIRVLLSSKDRASDYQRISIAAQRMTQDNLS